MRRNFDGLWDLVSQKGPDANTLIGKFTLTNDEVWHVYLITSSFLIEYSIMNFLDRADGAGDTPFYRRPGMAVIRCNSYIRWVGGVTTYDGSMHHQYVDAIIKRLEEERNAKLRGRKVFS